EDAEGNITFVNPQMADMLGYAKNELIGQHWSYISPPEQLDFVMKENRKRRQLITSTYEANLLKKDSTRIPVVVSGTPLLNRGGKFRGTLAVFTDVFALKQTEAALRESERGYRELVEKLHEGVLVEYNDKITFVNPQVTALLGYAEKELIGQHWRIIVAPSSVEKVKKENQKRVQGISSTYELDLLKKNGQTVPVIVSGTPYHSGDSRGTLAVFTDISKLKEVEYALRESEAKYRDILEKMNDGYYESDLKGNLTFVNRTMCEMLGYASSELLGMNYREFVGEKTHKEWFRVFNTLYRTREPVQAYVGSIIRKDGNLRFAETAPSLILDPNGSPIGFRGIFRDTTERRKAEEQLQQQKEELSEFARAMAHDLRNYLLAIEGYADLLATGLHDPIYAKRVSQLSRIANDLLQRSVELADAGMMIEKNAEVDLKQIVSMAANLTIPADVALKCCSLPKIRGDPEKLGQVFKNLLENAVVHASPKTIEIKCQDSDNCVNILISNDGEPISSENQEKVFDRGFTTKEEGGGLGLTIVKKLIEAHEWQITLDSAPETTFRISIPKSQILS
ncbi:MAG: PAS domain S-box protein, partial [Candidatus Hodarchaeota archaeon]